MLIGERDKIEKEKEKEIFKRKYEIWRENIY